MPDFGAPVAQNVNTDPNKGLTTIGDLMGLQQKQIAIDQGQATLASQQAQAQGNQQQMQERQYLQKIMADGKDELGNAVIDPETGQPNTSALAAAALRRMPLTGQDVVQNIIKTQDARLKLNDSVRTLGQNYRNDISGIVRSSIGTPDGPDEIGQKLDAYAQQNPMASDAIKRAQALLVNLPKDPKARDAALLHTSQEFQPAAATEGEQKPVMGTITGANGGVQPVQLNPLSPVPQGASGPEVKQGLGPTIYTDAAGKPHFVGGGAGGNLGGSDQYPSSTDVGARNAAAADMSDHYKRLNASAANMPLTNALTKTIESFAPTAFTDVGGDKKQYVAGVLRSLNFTPTGNAETDTNLMNKAMAQLNLATPAATDAARVLTEAGRPNAKMDPVAIKDAAGTVASQMKMDQAERDFLTTARYRNGGAGDSQTYQQGRQQFEANADPRIWQYEELAKNDRAAARAFIGRQPDKADLIRKAGALEGMGFFR